jgi:hypothetical protein
LWARLAERLAVPVSTGTGRDVDTAATAKTMISALTTKKEIIGLPPLETTQAK